MNIFNFYWIRLKRRAIVNFSLPSQIGDVMVRESARAYRQRQIRNSKYEG